MIDHIPGHGQPYVHTQTNRHARFIILHFNVIHNVLICIFLTRNWSIDKFSDTNSKQSV